MKKSAILNVSWASASDKRSATFTTGMTGKYRWMTIGPISEIEASTGANRRLG